jgi:serine/threonine protein kinase
LSRRAQLLALHQDAERIYTCLEYCEKGDFFSHLKKGSFGLEVSRIYARQLLQGVAPNTRSTADGEAGVLFLHRNGVVHRDLSLENLLLDANGTLKICDFGAARAAGRGQR